MKWVLGDVIEPWTYDVARSVALTSRRARRTELRLTVLMCVWEAGVYLGHSSTESC